MKVIVNATPLIALSKIDQLELLNKLFDEVIIPESVYLVQNLVNNGIRLSPRVIYSIKAELDKYP